MSSRIIRSEDNEVGIKGDINNTTEDQNIAIYLGKSNIGFMRITKRTNISCGVRELSGLHTLYNSNATSTQMENILSLLIGKMKGTCAFVLVSNNNMPYQGDENRTINKVLDKMSHRKTIWKVNPNSQNKIRVWIL